MASVPRWTYWALGLVCLAAVAYTVERALFLRLDYFDGYAYLANTRRLAGDRWVDFDIVRPPLISLLQLPAVFLAKMGPPAGLAYLVGPHLASAVLSVLTAFAVFCVVARPLGRPAALLGVVLFVTSRMFVRYGAMTMADVLSAGVTAAALGLFQAAQARPRWGLDVLAGVALGAAMASKFPLLALGGVLVVSEALLALRRRALSGRRVLGLAISLTTGAITFLGLMALTYQLAFGPPGLALLFPRLGQARTALAPALGDFVGESRWDFLGLYWSVTAWPVTALALLGLTVAFVQRRKGDLLFGSWLFGLGGAFVWTMGHNEARYLLPLVPAVMYFAVRGADRVLSLIPSRPVAGAAALVLAAASAVGGIRQAVADRDRIFSHDVERASAAALLRTRRPGGALGWIGGFTCLYPQDGVPLPDDEYFDSFHFYRAGLEYFTGEPVLVRRSLAAAGEGDAILVPGPNCTDGQTGPRPPLAPWSAYGVRRYEMVEAARPLPTGPAIASRQYATADGALALELAERPTGLAAVVRRAPSAVPDHRHLLIVTVAGGGAPRTLGPLVVTGGLELALGRAPATAVAGVTVLDLTLLPIPVL